ncbi:MAG: energy-coupling factor transporter ATPase [Bacillaceae bacterium]|nr:energy-coupling factor transporter ATPase [Bacillaceae bacterium]
MEIKTKELTYSYGKNTPFENNALKNINISIPNNKFTSIIGHTGSGKSTLIQILNGLLTPTSGIVLINGNEITNKTKQKDLYLLRKDVGMVFQFPEHQLFEETVIKDVMFGPINMGLTKNEAWKIGKEMLKLVGIGEELHERSPFQLSGGQKRRVAIAGVLAIQPKILILDEPSAGLDPVGQEEIMELFYQWYKGSNDRSIILVTHQMEDAAKYSDLVFVMNNGGIYLTGSPETVFSRREALEEVGLTIPETISLLSRLRKKTGFVKLNPMRFTREEVVKEILSIMGKD